jgi:transglutaminase-like putative cysteine protease
MRAFRFNPLAYRPPTPQAAVPLGPLKVDHTTTEMYVVSGDRDTQARKKLDLIRRHVIEPALSNGPRGMAYTRRLLAQALQRAPHFVNGHHKAREAVWIFEWVRRQLRYVNDPTRRELFQQLPELFQGGIGDCDDFTAALGALLKAAGFNVKARLIELRPGGGWAHIYPLVELKGRGWVPLDATENHPAGWQARHHRALDLEL